jgi:hypothetical protein
MAMPVVSRLIYEVVKWRARRGLSDGDESLNTAKEKARRRGIRDETFDVTAIDEQPGRMPEVRLYENTFSPAM